MKGVLAMILAGGRGRRMGILCRERAKPALPFAGRFRVIDFCLSNCVHSGIQDIAILVDYQRSKLASYLTDGVWLQPTDSLNLRILAPKLGSYRGTADAVYQHIHHIEQCGADLILILAADHIYNIDYSGMLNFHCEAGADVTVGVTSVPIVEAHRFGITSTDVKGRIVDFVEKPEIPQSNLASMGIYVFNKQALVERLREDAAQVSSPHDFGHAIIPNTIKNDKVFAYRFNGYWRDIGNIRAYYRANMELTGQTPLFRLDDNWPVFARKDNTIPPKISGEVRHSLISPGCVIKGQVESSVLSPGVWVEEQAVVKDSVLMASTFVGRHSVVDHCILDEEVSIGKFCYIGFNTGSVPDDWDITVVGKNTTVPSYTAIGRGCKVLPNAGLADFTTRAIPPGSIVSPRTMTPLINKWERRYMTPIT